MSDTDAADFEAAYAAAAQAIGQLKPPKDLGPAEQDQFWAAAPGYLEMKALDARRELASEIRTE